MMSKVLEIDIVEGSGGRESLGQWPKPFEFQGVVVLEYLNSRGPWLQHSRFGFEGHSTRFKGRLSMPIRRMRAGRPAPTVTFSFAAEWRMGECKDYHHNSTVVQSSTTFLLLKDILIAVQVLKRASTCLNVGRTRRCRRFASR